jgi:Ni,Fe-hydrogenase III large subunit/Ni,Fe-hydrogenase III component G
MNLSPLGLTTATVAAAVPARRATVTAVQLLAACRLARDQGGRLVALWLADERDLDRGFCLRVVLQDDDGLTLLEHSMVDGDVAYPDLAPMFPAANRMQRAAFDLVGVPADGDDQRPWLRSASWPPGQFPLRRDFAASTAWEPGTEEYPFVKVEGDGVHEIPVGPVHAGTIEPGHFRFQVVGEKVLRLEERLGWAHKGIEKRFESMTHAEGYRLAGRVSGDSTVAYAWAYAQAIEAIAETTVPTRASWLRALCLERERIANHLGDLGFLGNDAGLAFGLAQFSRLREDMLRLNRAAFGHRLLMDVVVPGGIAVDMTAMHADAMREEYAVVAQQVRILRDIYDEHAGLQDRFRNCGRVTPLLAMRLGLTGLAGRASRQAYDLRCDFPCAPYATLAPRMVTASEGDVAARVAVRFDEVGESLRLVLATLDALADPELAADIRTPLPRLPELKLGIGMIEGWRGPVLIALTSGPGGTIRRCHPHDPSWSNWPVIEHAIIDNIVPDFPLINKSFNLSYSGHDL